MDPISASSAQGAQGADELQLALLKKTLDLSKQQGAEMIAMIPPPPRSPSPPGVGGRIDITA